MTTAQKTKLKLDVACGQNKQEGFRGIDIAAGSDADDVHDLTDFPWPYEDDSVSEVFCSHYVEHIPQTVLYGGKRGGQSVKPPYAQIWVEPPETKDGLCAFMDELWRVMEDGAEVRIVHPHLRTDRAFQDPTHVRFIPEATWPYFARDWREANKLDHYPIACDFGIERLFYNGFQGDWEHRNEQARQFAIVHYWNVVIDLVVDLKCRKS